MATVWREALRKGMHKSEAQAIAAEVVASRRVANAVESLTTDPDRTVSGKASWVMAIACEADASIAARYADSWIARIADNLPENVTREYLRALLASQWHDSFESALIDGCFRILSESGHDTGVYYNALRILQRACTMWPELGVELRLAAARFCLSENTGLRALAMRISR